MSTNRDNLKRDLALSDLLVATPAVVGAGISINNFIRSLDRSFSDAMVTNAGHTTMGQRLSESAAYATQAVSGQEAVNRFISRLNTAMQPQVFNTIHGTQVRGPLDPETVLFAWQRAASSLPEELAARIDPGQLHLEKPIESASQVFRDVLPRFGTQYRNKFMHVFNANLQAIQDLPDTTSLMNMQPILPKFTGEEFTLRTIEGVEGLPEPLRKYAQRFQDMLGVPVQGTFRTRPEWLETGLGEYRLSIGDDIVATVPRSVEGQILSGKDLTTRRLAGYFGIWNEATGTLKKMSFSEYLMHRIEKDIVPQMTQGKLTRREISNSIQELQSSLLSRMETIPAMPPKFEGEALRGYAKLRSQYLHLVTPEGAPIPVAQAAKMSGLKDLIGSELFPSGPSQMEQGKAFLTNPANLYLGPEAAPQQRQLSKTFRAVGVMESRMPPSPGLDYSWLFSHQHKELFGQHPGVIAKTVFLKNEGLEARTLPGQFGEGEFEMTTAWAKRAQGVRDRTISVSHMSSQLRDYFADNAALSQDLVMPRGTLVGWGEDWNPILLHHETKIKGAMKRGTGAELFLEEVLAEQQPKFFMTKLRGLPVPEDVMKQQKTFSRLPYTPDVRMSADILGKELHLANMQQTSMLWATLKELPKQERVALPAHIQDFMSRPAEMMNQMVSASTKQGAYQHAAYTASLVNMAQEAALKPAEFGRIFGGAPITLGENWYDQIRSAGAPELTKMQQWAIQNVSPTGTIFMTAGGPRAERGPGKLASIEPRMFTMLEAGPYGELGTKLSKELAKRTALDSPEAVLASQEVAKSLSTFERGIPSGGLERFPLRSSFDAGSFMQFAEKGGLLEIGAGRPDIYVPSMEHVRAMTPFETPSGRQTLTELAATYRDLARSASDVQAGRLSVDQFLNQTPITEGAERGLAEGAYYQSMQKIQRQHAPMGKGTLGLFRGQSQRVVGSRFLELTSALAETAERGVVRMNQLPGADAFTVGLSDFWFEQMLKDLKQNQLLTDIAAEDMTKRWKHGEAVGGMVWRHPIIGPYSAMPIKMQRVPTAGREALALVSEGPLSVLMGLAADKDADMSGFMLLGGDLEKNARQFWNEESIQRYSEHVSRLKTLKPKAPKMAAELAAVSVHDLARVAVEQMSMPEHYLPKLSTTITEMKYALGTMPSSDMKSSAFTVLEALEQFPISGKHLTARQVVSQLDQQGYKPMMEGIVGAIRRGDAEGLGYWFKESIGGQRRIAESAELQRVLGEGGLQLDKTLGYMSDAWQRYAGTETARDVQLLTGRGKYLQPAELGGYIQRGLGKIMPEVDSAPRGRFGAMLSEAALTVSNTAGALGKKIIKHAKPLAWGAAATLGLAAILSRPEEMVGSGQEFRGGDTQASIPRGNTQAQYKSPENLHPPEGVIGNPTPPLGISSPSARIGGERGHRVEARLQTGSSNIDPALLARELERSVGNVKDVQVTVRDGRSILNVNQLLNDLG